MPVRLTLVALGMSLAAGSASAGGETAKLTASDGVSDDYCGYSVGVSGDLAIVGAPHHSGSGGWSGAAYLYDALSGVELSKLVAADGALTDQFGFSVAVSGTTGIVGAPGDNANGTWSGSAYLFDLKTGLEFGKLLASDGLADDHFGTSVAISGTTALVGSYGGNGDHGSVYVFDTTTGLELRQLVASDSDPDELFGFSCSISGGLAIVGAPHDDAVGLDAGSAYLFDVATGTELAKLTASDAADMDAFGWSVAISGTIIVAGARSDDDRGSNSGAAYLFDATTGLELFKLLAADGAADDEFGYSVAVSGATVLVGSHGHDDNGSESGAAYKFDASTGTLISKLTPSDGQAGSRFGWSVAVDGAQLLIGAYQDSTPTVLRAGSAYVFGPTVVTSYCTAGTSASGCRVNLAATGTSSVSAPTGFVLIAAGVEGQKDGMFFFGLQGRQLASWGNGTSFQCVAPPVARVDVMLGTGTAGTCDGGFTLDLNAHWTAKPTQEPVPGTLLQAQLWYRDPLNTSNQTTSLSDALEFCVGP